MPKSEITNDYIEGLHSEMQEKISELEADKATPEIISDMRTAYEREISENILEEAKTRQYLNGFLTSINKVDCPEAEYKIRQFFFGIPKWREIQNSPSGPLSAHRGMVSAYAKRKRADPDKQKISAAKKNKLQKLLKLQKEVLQLCSDVDIRIFYEEIAENNHEVKSAIVRNCRTDFLRDLAKNTFELDLLLNHKEPLPSGLDSLEEYVYRIARLYEEVASEKFDFMRHKTEQGADAGEYFPITNAHSFVVKAVEWMQDEFSDNDVAYTSTNICTVCENVRARLNKERRQ